LIKEHCFEVFLVDRTIHRLQHTADLYSRCSVGVDARTLEHPLELFFYWFEESFGEFEVSGGEDQFLSFTQSDEHRDLKE